MSGLISRVVFIWPSWDEKNHTARYKRIMAGIGWYVPDPKKLDKPKELCMCMVGNPSVETLVYFDEALAVIIPQSTFYGTTDNPRTMSQNHKCASI